jgi:hypothetical protein
MEERYILMLPINMAIIPLNQGSQPKGAMKTTIEVPDELFRQAKATAAMRGISLKVLITEALKHEVEANPLQAVPLDRFIEEWEALARKNNEAWKSARSALEQLTADRNARGGR